MLGALGYVVQLGLINRVVTRSVLVTLILTFGLELMMNNAMLVSFSADYKKVLLEHPLGIAACRQRLHSAGPRRRRPCSRSC